MTIYFSSNKLPELEKYSIKERQEILAKAQQKFTAPEKLMLNLLKLVMLTPPFLFLARQEWGNFSIVIIIAVVIQILISQPIKFKLIRKYLSS